MNKFLTRNAGDADNIFLNLILTPIPVTLWSLEWNTLERKWIWYWARSLTLSIGIRAHAFNVRVVLWSRRSFRRDNWTPFLKDLIGNRFPSNWNKSSKFGYRPSNKGNGRAYQGKGPGSVHLLYSLKADRQSWCQSQLGETGHLNRRRETFGHMEASYKWAKRK